jgi:hypothetical protein
VRIDQALQVPTYSVHSIVQACQWKDIMFPDPLAPPWDELVTELKARNLPADHGYRIFKFPGFNLGPSLHREFIEGGVSISYYTQNQTN